MKVRQRRRTQRPPSPEGGTPPRTQPREWLGVGVIGIVCLLLTRATHAQQTFDARDSLHADDAIADLAWTPGRFVVTVEDVADREHDARVTFDSAVESDLPAVTLAWYRARDGAGEPVDGPALLLVHSLHPQMPIARMLASNLSRRGLHCFIVHLPGYGERGDGSDRFPGVVALLHGRQGIADVRRARDAVAALPGVTGDTVALQGTSLGGFVASVAAGMDGAFEPVFLLLSGGDAHTVLTTGGEDAARLYARMREAGYDGERLATLLAPFEPMRLAHRLNPERTWLYSARADQVVSRQSSERFSAAAGLAEPHHLWLDGNHYTAALLLPMVVEHIAATVMAPAGHPDP